MATDMPRPVSRTIRAVVTQADTPSGLSQNAPGCTCEVTRTAYGNEILIRCAACRARRDARRQST